MVCQATTAQDVRIRIGAFSCLHEIAAGYYGKLPPYMPEIFNISVKAINGDEEDVALQVRLGSVAVLERGRLRGTMAGGDTACLPAIGQLHLTQQAAAMTTFDESCFVLLLLPGCGVLEHPV